MKDRIENLKKALRLEQKTELQRYRALIEEQSMSDRIASGVTIYPVQYNDYSFNAFEELILSFSIRLEQAAAAFSSNGKVQIFSSIQQESIEGIVDRIEQDQLLIQLSDERPPEWIKAGKIGINALPDTRTTETQLVTLDKITTEEIRIAHQFYTFPTRQEFAIDALEFDGFNPSQNEALSAALSANPFQIIHGPPGTGKTQTLVKIILEMAANGKRILVAAPTNTAVDHITRQLSKKTAAILRMGNSLKIDPDIKPLTLKGKLIESGIGEITKRLKKEADTIRKKAFRYVRNFDKSAYEERKSLRKELNTIRKDIRQIERNLTKASLEKANIITGTFMGLQDKQLDAFAFDLVVVDEAGQALEPAIWSVAHKAPKLILAGDPFQLPPTLFAPESQKLGLNVSLIEKGIELGIPTTLLDVQYRMNDKIMQFSNQFFYHGKLMSANHIKTQHLTDEIYEPIEFIDTAGCGYDEVNDETGGIHNPKEIALIEKRYDQLTTKEDTCILSPYRLQVRFLQEHFEDTPLLIQTIDSFQGQEQSIIFVSLVRSNDQTNIGFLSDYRRMNVALTRARKKLIVVGDSATIGADSFYGDFLDYVEKNGSYRSAWEFVEG